MSDSKFMATSLANKSVVERVVDQITNAIINGELKPGDKIPTEPELCQSFGVGRNSVREAIKILEAYGVVEIRRADGTYIRQEYNDRMLYPILYGIILQRDSQAQIVELRKVIDIGILEEAMNRLGEEQFEQLEQEIAVMGEEIHKDNPSSRAVFESDVRFHAIISGVMKNDLLESIGSYVDQITRQTRILTIDYILQNGYHDELITLHTEMRLMLREKRKDAISSIVEKHYKYWEK